MATKTMTRAEIVRLRGEYDSFGDRYPSDDGEPMAENDRQFTAIIEMGVMLRNVFSARPDVYVAGDMFVYYRRGERNTRVAPDVLVVIGADGNHPRYSWLIWEEGGKVPDFVMEVAGESTWVRDATEKRAIYAALGVLEYWRFDPTGEFFSPALIGERLVDGEYRSLGVGEDESGILRGHSDALGLDICVLEDKKLHLYDTAAGEWILTPSEQNAAYREQREALRERDAELREERAARRESESKLAEYEAEVERLRAQLREERQGQ